jgi:nucleotide-binding universal stress UspA family protein
VSATLPAWLEGAQGAPSAHNTQPWLFQPLADGRVVVGWRHERMLLAGDPTGRDLYLALGCAVESARMRALAAGQSISFTPASDDEPDTVGMLVPSAGEAEPADAALAALLAVRHTARVPHLPRPIPGEVREAMRREAASYGCELYITTKARRIQRLARLARQATAAQFADREVHAELWRWLRLDPNDPAYKRDGLTADCLNLNGAALVLARLTMPPARMQRLSKLGMHHILALDTEWTVRKSASICLLTARDSSCAGLVRAGRGLLRIWLLAAQADLTTHPVSALLDCAATVAPTLDVFGCAEAFPAAVFRLGAAAPVPRAPRLPAEELLEAMP